MRFHRFLIHILAGVVVFLTALGTTVAQEPDKASPADDVVLENEFVRLSLGTNGRVREFVRLGGASLLSDKNGCPLMLVRIGSQWHESVSLTASDDNGGKWLKIGFEGVKITARAIVRVHSSHLAVETIALDGEDAGAVEQWVYVNLPINISENLGGCLNVAWDARFAVAVIALEERTEANGAPVLRASAHRGLGFGDRKAAIIGCPTPEVLSRMEQIEQQYGLPSPKLDGQWAKTSTVAKKSWMITGLTLSEKPAVYRPEAVFKTAKMLGVEYVVISLGWWNSSFGRYAFNRYSFPDGVASLKQAADEAHAAGLKLGLHVMSTSVSKHDAYATPKPDPRLQKEGEVTLAADIDAATSDIPTMEPPTSFGTATGYWAAGGVDVQIDDEFISYREVRTDSPFALLQCTRGVGGTQAAPHKAGAKVQRIAERYGWYIANPELAGEIGQNMANLINEAGLDMICFDGADVPYVSSPSLQYYFGHQVAAGVLRHAKRDVVLVSNGTTHFGWHLVTRGGEDDAMALGYQRWVDDYTVHRAGKMHVSNFLAPDFSWTGVFGQTATLKAARPDDVEMASARSLGFDGAIGWGFAACFGGPSDMETFEKNGRKEEIAGVITAYDRLRMQGYFPEEYRKPLCEQGTHWRLLPPKTPADRYRIARASYPKSEIIRPGVEETMTWRVENRFAAQPLRVRIEAMPAVSPYGANDNLVVSDFAVSQFTTAGHPSAKTVLEQTKEVHPAAGTVVRFACAGPDPALHFPRQLTGVGQTCWAEAKTMFTKPLDLTNHRAVGLWVHGNGGGETLDVRLDFGEAAYLHFFLPITFTGWKYCELGEPEGDRVMDYFTYDKFAMHDMPLAKCVGVTLAILMPPEGKEVELRVGRIEALHEVGGELANPRVTVGDRSLVLPVSLEGEQYLETGDLWGDCDPRVCRVFDADGNELRRLTLDVAPPTVPVGSLALRFATEGEPPARAKVSLILLSAPR